MFGFLRKRGAAPQPEYATRAELCRIFNDEMKGLYLLAFLLAANHAEAGQCFVASIGDAVEGNPVFKEWALAWARRIIIKNAIRIISPMSAHADWKRDVWNEEGDEPSDGLAIGAITRLAPLERFVFVMSVLERYPDRECAVLLSCAVEEVREARACALQHSMTAKSNTAATVEVGDVEAQSAHPLMLG